MSHHLKAGPEDVPAIDRCNRAVLAENYTRELYHQLLAAEAASCCWVAEEMFEAGEEIVGYVLLYVEVVRGRGVCHVMSLGIQPEHRRHGHAEALMRAARDDMMERATSRSLRFTSESPTRALRPCT